MTNICIWGDSVMRGVVYDDDACKYIFLQNSCIPETAKNFDIRYINNSKFGMTAPKAFEKMKKTLEENDFKPDFALIELGGNDCDFDWREVALNPDVDHEPNTPVNEYEKTIKEMVTALREKGIEPVLTNLHPIDPVKYLDWITKDGLSKEAILKWLKDVFKIYRFQELYSLTINKISQPLDVRLIDIRKAFLRAGNLMELLCKDGIHPNEKGHEIMTSCLVEYISDFKREAMQGAV
jgi:lysophospholipase L1-like esterase